MNIKIISHENRKQVNNFIMSNWQSLDMVVKGEIVDMAAIDGFIAYDKDDIIGLVTYRIEDKECEIMSLDSLRENQGIGTTLVNKVVEIATKEKCIKVKLITTNDNINALRFYQKRSFDMAHLYHNAVNTARSLKPSIPMLGDFDIPIKHEIEFEMSLLR
jgi:ribosomal protein S18 acetylase RimI-like enzyme